VLIASFAFFTPAEQACSGPVRASSSRAILEVLTRADELVLLFTSSEWNSTLELL
jgi:hypothetical protein